LIADGAIIAGSFDHSIVLLSVFISVLGAYAAIDVAERAGATGGSSFQWAIGAAASSAISTWAMHYVGMLAFQLPVTVVYHWPTALLSFVPAFVTAAAALILVTRLKASSGMAWLGGILVGAGIAGLHYTGMASMRSSAMHHYSPPLVAISVVLPMLCAAPALKLTFPGNGRPQSLPRKAAGAVLLGVANPVMHYTAMAGTTFMTSGVQVDFSEVADISSLSISGINIVTTMVIGAALVTSLVDRLREQRVLLDELFEQAPQAVALMDADDRVVRVNREFTRLFGYPPQEVIGRRLAELIGPDDPRVEETSARRQEMESVRRRKDGNRLHVSIVRVPVVVPGKQVSVYAIYRDISDRKRAEEILESFSQKLIETQEGERQRVARQLHDEIGQVLTAIRLNLNAVQHSMNSSPVARKLDETMTIIDRALDQVRELSLDLRPLVLDDLGLLAALRWYVDREAQRAGFAPEFSAGDLERLPPELETACFRIAQEALTNVVRHSKAKQVRVELNQSGDELHLIVRDDGIGFDPAGIGGSPADVKLGLLGMRERALIVGGTIEVVSAPGKGTEVHARFPLKRSGQISRVGS
jgi:PAS domain S-box-containing protein